MEQQLHSAGEETGAMVARACHFFNEGDFSLADKFVGKARLRSPHDPFAAGMDAKVKLKTGRYSEAVRLFAEAMRLADPDEVPGAFVWAESLSFYFQLCQTEGGKAVCEEPRPEWCRSPHNH